MRPIMYLVGSVALCVSNSKTFILTLLSSLTDTGANYKIQVVDEACVNTTIAIKTLLLYLSGMQKCNSLMMHGVQTPAIIWERT